MTSVVGATAGCSTFVVAGAEGDEGGGGGGRTEDSVVSVCICDAGSMAVEVVTSVGVTTEGSSVTGAMVGAVRARERVHRLPLTVVIDSWGEAMQAIGQRAIPARAQKKRQREKAPSAAGALDILNWEIRRFLLCDAE